EYAKKLTAFDIKVLTGQAAYSEKVPNVDYGFTAADIRDPRRGGAVARVIETRLAQCRKDRPGGYLVPETPAAAIPGLKTLPGHLQAAQSLTNSLNTFPKAEMDDDRLLVPAKLNGAEDKSDYQEILPSPPPSCGPSQYVYPRASAERATLPRARPRLAAKRA